MGRKKLMALTTIHFLQKGTIKSRLLVAFILLVLLPTSAVTLTNAILDFSKGKELIKNQLFSVATIKASQVNDWVDLLERDLRIILAIVHLKEFSDKFHNKKLYPHSELELKYFQQNLNKIFQTSGSFEEIFFLSPSGSVILSTDEKRIGQFRGGEPYFSEGIKRPGVHVQTHAFSTNHRNINQVIAVHPVYNNGGELIGVLCGQANMTRLQEIISAITGPGDIAKTYLVGKNRVLLIDSRLPDHYPGNIFVSSNGINTAIDRHESGSGIYKDFRGVSVLGVYLWVPKIEVALLSEMYKSEAFTAIYVMLAINISMGLFALILAIIFSIFFARGIADPLSELATTATCIAAGKLYMNVQQDRKDEIGVLYRAFNRMADQMSRRLEINSLISDMSREFISIPSSEIDRTIYKALKTFGQYYGADQGYVFRVSSDTEFFIKIHEWQKEENGILINKIQVLWTNQTNPWLITQLQSRQVVYVPCVEDLPIEATSEKAHYLFKGIHSFVCIPLVFGESLKGFIGFNFMTESRRINEEDIRFLRMIGEIISNSLERQHADAALKHSQEQYALAQRAANIGSLDLDLMTGKLYCSDTTWSILGRKKDDYDPSYDFFLSIVHPEDRDILNKAVRESIKKNKNYDIEHRILLPDQSLCWVLMTGAVVRNENDIPIRMIGMIRDITERKESADKINASLKEKEVLLKEIHHRVKNNLQVISSLMYLQSKNFKDPAMAGIFKDCESRIRSMALVHERLYQSKSMAEIDFVEYVRSLGGYLVQSFGEGNGSIRLEIQIDKIFLSVNTAIPCGLIISELVSNALKHAYPGGKKGEIMISFTRDKTGTYTQIVKDNGIGLQENLDFQNMKTLGLRLVNILAKQLNGSLTYSGKDGACFVLKFNEPNYSIQC
jgi:two-component sensor histidine kinase/PAS domain-containing protein/HAMP domain-containing protein